MESFKKFRNYLKKKQTPQLMPQLKESSAEDFEEQMMTIEIENAEDPENQKISIEMNALHLQAQPPFVTPSTSTFASPGSASSCFPGPHTSIQPSSSSSYSFDLYSSPVPSTSSTSSEIYISPASSTTFNFNSSGSNSSDDLTTLPTFLSGPTSTWAAAISAAAATVKTDVELQRLLKELPAKHQRSTGILSIRGSPGDRDVLPVWYLNTHYDDLFDASTKFKYMRIRLTPRLADEDMQMLIDGLDLSCNNGNSGCGASHCFCIKALRKFRCKRCRILKFLHHGSPCTSPSPVPKPVPKHPRPLYPVSPASSTSWYTPIFALMYSTRPIHRTTPALPLDLQYPLHRSQSCSF